MFNIWNKKRIVTLEFITMLEGIASGCPPFFAKEDFPLWFKPIPNKAVVRDLQSDIDLPYGTIKTCDGIREVFKNAIILPLWADFILKTQEDGLFTSLWPEFMYNLNTGDIHEFGTTYSSKNIPAGAPHRDIVPDGNNIFKDQIALHIPTPWLINTTHKDLKVLAESPHYYQYDNLDLKLSLFPGILKPYRLQQINIVPSLPKKDKQYNFKHGQPIMQLLPLTEDIIELHVRAVSRDESSNMNLGPMYRPSFTNAYEPQRRRLEKKEKKEQKSKCPFNFFK